MTDDIPSNAYTCKIQVRWKDTDMFGHVNNANYFTWLEAARLEWWKEQKHNYDGSRPRGIMANVKINYKSPIELHDNIYVTMWLERIGHKSHTNKYILHNQELDKIYADASTVIVSYDFEQDHSTPIPDEYRELLSKFKRSIEVSDGNQF